MGITLREGRIEDAAGCGPICDEAFRTIPPAPNFPPDFPSPDVATGLLSMMLSHPEIHGVVAELDGRIVGSNFMDERCVIPGIGPITVDPKVQNSTIGRRLMEHMLDRVAQRGCPGVRLVQAGYHNRSLCLYTKLGFETREPLSTIQGPALTVKIPGTAVRRATEADLAACNQICFAVHGFDRSGELRDAVQQGTATVVERGGRITGYATAVAFFGHAAGETNDDVTALI